MICPLASALTFALASVVNRDLLPHMPKLRCVSYFGRKPSISLALLTRKGLCGEEQGVFVTRWNDK
jgi:hypothetical protein